MDKDRITGSAEDFAGKVGNTVGGMTGDAKAQAEGLARQTAGKAQNLYGQTRDGPAKPRTPQPTTPVKPMKTAAMPSATARKPSQKESRRTHSARS